jgi:hypothetical protein
MEGGGTTKLTQKPPILALLVGLLADCAGPPGGGVSGIVLAPSGKPVEGAEVVLIDAPKILGVVVPWQTPVRLVTNTDDFGRFRFWWNHGDPKGGLLLEVSASRYARSSTRLGPGYLECEVRLKPVGETALSSEARCVERTAAQSGE